MRSKRSRSGLLLVAVLLVASLTLTACFNCGGGTFGGGDLGPRVAMVDGMEVYEAEVMFTLAQAEQMFLSDNMDLFPDAMMALMFGMPADIDYDMVLENGQTVGEAILEQAVRIAAMYRMYVQFAEQNGIRLTLEEREMIDEHIAFLIEHFDGEEGLREAMQEDNIRSLDHLRDISELSMILGKVVEAIIEDDAEFARFEAYLQPGEDEELFGAQHILITFAERTEEEAEELANQILARALAGEDFAALMAEYGEDPGMDRQPEGYTFADGVMVQDFTDATMALEIGEISGLVRNDVHGGFHIIRRIEPPDPANAMRPQQGGPSTLEERRAMAVHDGFMAMANAAEITFLPAFESIRLGQ